MALLTVGAVSAVSAIGADLGFKIVTGIASSARNITTLMGFIKKKGSKTELIEFLEEKDIVMRVNTLHCVVSELKINKNTPVSISNCLKGLHQIIKSIEYELTAIRKKIEYNKKIYWAAKFRKFKLKSNLRNINNFVEIMESRRKLLYETVSIGDNLIRGNINETNLLEGTMIGVHEDNTRNMSKEKTLEIENIDCELD